MSNVIKSINEIFKNQHRYFSEYREEIAIRNLELMCTISSACIIVYGVYFSITNIFFKQWSISFLYALFIPVMLILFMVTKKFIRDTNRNTKHVMTLTMIMYIVVMSEVIILSIFPHPDDISIYYSLFLLMGSVFFILPIRSHLLMTFTSVIVFCVLTIKFKSPEIWPHELFEAITASIFSVVCIIIMTQFRLQSDRIEGKYYKLSQQDGLTKLLNKSAGLNVAERYLQEMIPQEHFAVLFLDIDDFKQINDTYGHVLGDQLINVISSIMRDTCRTNDILCRFGGDEFFILLKDVADVETAKLKAEKIIDEVNDSSFHSTVNITISIGVYFSKSNEMSIKEVLKKADTALYQAKNNGKNCVEVYKEL
ncbi:MAG: GGDEF domain-containing protein [Peptostreptococcaceae bacterium]|nr:GGDEF domain-containing protein [Peptostreptococcaceae bacterium]